MTYTFWHLGVLIGEANLASMSGNRSHLGGIFHPTEAGLALLPQLCSIVRIGNALQKHLRSTGQSLDRMSPDEAQAALTACDEGRAILDFGRTMSEIELRGPDGVQVGVASMGFSDTEELRRLASASRGRSAKRQFKRRLQGDAPRYIVSATLGQSALRDTAAVH
ncbi:MAG: hypothetical protein V4617_20285 [Gemmatimonadota bacterium]